MTRRLLATLSSIPSSSSAPAGPFIPPYAHSTAPPRSAPSSLRPPYAHSLPSGAGPSRIGAPYRFSIPSTSNDAATEEKRAEEWARWARGLVDNDAGREGVMRIWEETLEGLTRARVDHGQIPELSYSALSEHLADTSAVESIKSAGSVVVRDVVPDSVALGWAKEIRAAMEQRGGDAVYWHPALLEARFNVSILNTTTSILSALTGITGRQAGVLAESAREGLGSDLNSGRWATGNPNNPWAINTEPGPSTPLLSHLTLTPPSTTLPTLLPGIHSATYALLRPFFRPIRSRISFYSSTAYLDPSNWALAPISSLTPTISGSEKGSGLPHLVDMPRRAVRLNPGDMVLRNTLLPVAGGVGGSGDVEGTQAFLSVAVLADTTGNGEYMGRQEKAYEAGLPPPLVAARGMWGERGAVRVEQTRS